MAWRLRIFGFVAGMTAILLQLCRCRAICASTGRIFAANGPLLARKGCLMGNVKTEVFRRAASAPSQAEAEPRQLEQVLEQIDEAVIVKDLDAIVVYWNREATSLYGFSRDEAIGQPLDKLHAADLSATDYARLLARIRAGKPTSSTTERRKRSGEKVRVSIRTTPLLDAAGQLVGEITVARDVTQALITEEALRSAQEAL